MQIRLVSYNILQGLHSKEKTDGPAQLDPARMEAASQVVGALRPDVLMLTEVCMPDYNSHGLDIDYRGLFGLDYQIDIGPVSDSNHGSAILSRFPVGVGRNYSDKRFKHLKGFISPVAEPITIDLVHPHVQLTEAQRTAFIKRVASPRRVGKRRIIGGDFNAYSSDDTYDRDKTIQSYREFLKDPTQAEGLVADLLTCRTIDFAKSIGLKDTYRMFHSDVQHRTVPTQLRKGGDEGARVDYIFCSPDIKVLEAGIHTADPASVASDHFPVFATIEVKS